MGVRNREGATMAITANGQRLSKNELAKAYKVTKLGKYRVVQIGSYLAIVKWAERIKHFSIPLANRNLNYNNEYSINASRSSYPITSDKLQKCLDSVPSLQQAGDQDFFKNTPLAWR
jgi:hypothetical protein